MLLLLLLLLLLMDVLQAAGQLDGGVTDLGGRACTCLRKLPRWPDLGRWDGALRGRASALITGIGRALVSMCA